MQSALQSQNILQQMTTVTKSDPAQNENNYQET